MISPQKLRQSVPYTVNTLFTYHVTLRKFILNIWGLNTTQTAAFHGNTTVKHAVCA